MTELQVLFTRRMEEARREMDKAEEKFQTSARALADIVSVQSGLGDLTWDKTRRQYRVVYRNSLNAP